MCVTADILYLASDDYIYQPFNWTSLTRRIWDAYKQIIFFLYIYIYSKIGRWT